MTETWPVHKPFVNRSNPVLKAFEPVRRSVKITYFLRKHLAFFWPELIGFFPVFDDFYPKFQLIGIWDKLGV